MVRDEVESRATTTEMNKYRDKMAHSSGFEPETYRLEIGCSIQLSYECMIG